MNVKTLLRNCEGKKKEVLDQAYAEHLDFFDVTEETKEEKERFMEEFGAFFDQLLQTAPKKADAVLFYACDNLVTVSKKELKKLYQIIMQTGDTQTNFAGIQPGSDRICLLSAIMHVLVWEQEGTLDRPIREFLDLEVDPGTLGSDGLAWAAGKILHQCACFGRSSEEDVEEDDGQFHYSFDLSDKMEEYREGTWAVSNYIRRAYKKDTYGQRLLEAVNANPKWYGSVANAFRDYAVRQHSMAVPVYSSQVCVHPRH